MAQEALTRHAHAAHLIVGGHYPVHSPASHGPTECLNRKLKPMLERHRASVYFSGHDHALFHVAGERGVQYHGVGAGFTTTKSRRHLESCARRLRFHYRGRAWPFHFVSGGFVGVELTWRGLEVTHYDARGRALYSHMKPPRRSGEERNSNRNHSVSAAASRHAKSV